MPAWPAPFRLLGSMLGTDGQKRGPGNLAAVRIAAGAVFAVPMLALALPGGPASGFVELKVIHQLASSGLIAAGMLLALTAGTAIMSAGVQIAEAMAKLLGLLSVLAFSQPSDGTSGAGPGPDPHAATPPQSEIQAGAYIGGSIAMASDVTLIAPGGTDLVLKQVPWLNESLESPIFYGGRGMKWAETVPALGTMLDFTHAKATADLRAEVEQTGRREGEPVPPRGRVSDTFIKHEYTHGLNSLTMNGLIRLSGLHPRIRPYAGIGLGVMVPHVETRLTGTPRSEWLRAPQMTGPAVQALVGIEWRVFISNRWSAFTEYKFVYSWNTSHLPAGGKTETAIPDHQFIFGISNYLWRADPSLVY